MRSGDPSRDCFLSSYWSQPQRDVENFVVYRNERGMLLLNRYPYANGHLLAALGDARPTLLDYTEAQRAELMLSIRQVERSYFAAVGNGDGGGNGHVDLKAVTEGWLRQAK